MMGPMIDSILTCDLYSIYEYHMNMSLFWPHIFDAFSPLFMIWALGSLYWTRIILFRAYVLYWAMPFLFWTLGLDPFL